ncbi:hypothetical protein K4F52_007000 [Lecanicillium sp. MT-2017a]|nr:hypothetical protein K4F52_007000 [Lecanicillium sp. MT-2017a]
MDEKHLLGDPERPQPPQPKRPSKARRVIKHVFFVMLMIAVSFHLFRKAHKFCPGKHRDGLSIKYPGETIEWTPCGEVDGRDLECSSVEVPYDHWHKDGSVSGKTFTIALNRLRGKNGTKNMLVNPGGPGGSGLDLVKKAGKQLRTIVGEETHIVGFDPRGVGQSPPLAECFPDEETRKEHALELPTDPSTDSGFAFAYYKGIGQACADTMGDYAKYINTPQTAADMNSILDAVGQNGMVYWGFSYGTTLGQVYANLFPERSERVIIDGVSNQFGWFDYVADNTSLVDTMNVVDGFFTECMKAGDDCPLSKFADNAENLQKNVTRMINNLREDPVSLYVDEKTYGILKFDNLWLDAIFPATYTPAGWYKLANNLASYLSGDVSGVLKDYVLTPPIWAERIMEYNMVISNNDHPTGKDYMPQTRKEILETYAPMFNDTAFSVTTFSDYFARAVWPIPNDHKYSPSKEVETSHPMLILSTTYDPVCPLSSAQVAQKSFKHSRLVEVQGYGHCSIALQSSCAAKHVRAFLNNGTLPEEKHSKCASDGPYFIVPADKTASVSDVAMSEDEKIWAAQRELSEVLESFRL